LGEIDIVAQEGEIICFVEVKTRKGLRFGLPEEAVFNIKQKKLSFAALKFLKSNNLLDVNSRFDVVSVVLEAGLVQIKLIKNAFEFDLTH